MHNTQFEVTGDTLVIRIDLSAAAMAAAPASSTGKTRLLASTSGTCPVANVAGKPVSFSLNVMVKP